MAVVIVRVSRWVGAAREIVVVMNCVTVGGVTYLASEPSRQASRPPQNTPENENSRTEYLNNHILEFAKNRALELQLHKKEDYRISKL